MNKPCQYTKEDIWNYYSGRLNRRKETEMQEHIISCEACRKELEKLERLNDVISGEDEEENEMPDTAPRIPLIEPLIERGAAMPAAARPRKSRLIIYIIAAAAAIALILYLLLPKKEVNYPVDKDRQHIYGPGDSTKVDSAYIRSVTIDTIKADSSGIR